VRLFRQRRRQYAFATTGGEGGGNSHSRKDIHSGSSGKSGRQCSASLRHYVDRQVNVRHGFTDQIGIDRSEHSVHGRHGIASLTRLIRRIIFSRQ
jgi:hypothetical protein